MMVVVVYDISGTEGNASKRHRNVVRTCQKYGVRVQKSVFECKVDAEQYCRMKRAIADVIDSQKDSVRLYMLGNHYRTRMKTIGRDQTGWDSECMIL